MKPSPTKKSAKKVVTAAAPPPPVRTIADVAEQIAARRPRQPRRPAPPPPNPAIEALQEQIIELTSQRRTAQGFILLSAKQLAAASAQHEDARRQLEMLEAEVRYRMNLINEFRGNPPRQDTIIQTFPTPADFRVHIPNSGSAYGFTAPDPEAGVETGAPSVVPFLRPVDGAVGSIPPRRAVPRQQDPAYDDMVNRADISMAERDAGRMV